MSAGSADDASITVAASLSRIETKMDTLLDSSKDHETRIRWTERALYLALGAGFASGGVVGGFASNMIAK